MIAILLSLLLGTAHAQQAPAPQAPPERDALFWCKQQRNFAFDNAAENGAVAAKLETENTKLKAEIEELKKAQAKSP